MLKTTGLPNKPAPGRNDNSRSAFSRNNNNKLTFRRNNSNGEVDEFGGDDVKYTKKSGKLKS